MKVELAYLRKKSFNNFKLFASNYAFYEIDENEETDDDDDDDDDDNGDGDEDETTFKHRDALHCTIFGRLFKLYMKKQCKSQSSTWRLLLLFYVDQFYTLYSFLFKVRILYHYYHHFVAMFY